MKIVILGPQGSGKSTQAQLLAENLSLPMFDAGTFLRQKAREHTGLGSKIKKAVEKGELLPDEVVMPLFEEELKKEKYADGAVIDGTPRTISQAWALDEVFKIDKVIYLSVPDKVNIERLLKRKRHDDTPQLIKKRLALYHKKTEPILEYYRQKGVLFEVDGTRSIEEISKEIVGFFKNG